MQEFYNEGFADGYKDGYDTGHDDGYREKLLTQYDRVTHITPRGVVFCNSEYANLLETALNLACEWVLNDHEGTIEEFQDYFLNRAKEALENEKATQKEMGQKQPQNSCKR